MPSRWTSRAILRSLSCCPQGCWAGVAAHPQLHCPLITFTVTFPSILFISSSGTSLPGKRGGGGFLRAGNLDGSAGAMPTPRSPRSGAGAAAAAAPSGRGRAELRGARSPLPGARCPLCLPPQHPESVPSPWGQPRGAPGRGQQRSRSELRAAPGL